MPVCVGEWRARIGLHAHCKRDGETKYVVKSFLAYVRGRLAGLNPHGSSNTCRKDGPPPREAPAEQSKHSHSKCSNSCSKNAGIGGNCLTRDKESLLSQSKQESKCPLSAEDSVSSPEVGSSAQSNCHKPVIKYGTPQEQSLQTAGDMHAKGISFTPCSPIAQMSHGSRTRSHQHPEEPQSCREVVGCRTQPSKNGSLPVLMQSLQKTKVNQSNNDNFVKPDEARGGACSVSSSPLVKEGTPAMAITCSSTCPIKEATPTSVSTTSPIMEATPTSVGSTSPIMEDTTTSVGSTSPIMEATPTSVSTTSPIMEATPTSVGSTSPIKEDTTTSVSSTSSIKEDTPTPASTTSPIKEATPTSVSTTSPIMEATPTSVSTTSTIMEATPTSVGSTSPIKEDTTTSVSSTSSIMEDTPTPASTTSPIKEASPTSTIDQYGAGSMGHKSSQHGHEDRSQQRAFKSVEKGLTPYSSLGQGLKSFLHKLYSSTLHLRRAGDIETNPGPVQSPPSRGISHQELYALAEAMDPQYYTNVGLTLGLQEAALSQHRHDHRDSIKEATYAMLCDWLKNVPESESRGLLVQVLNECGLKQLSERVQTVAESSGINSTLSSAMTLEQLARCKKDIASFYRTEYCRIQTDPLDVDSFLDFEEIFTNLFLLEEAGREKRPIEYKDLLSLEISGQTVKRLLLQGEAGAGKTTLCCKIAWDWLNGGFKQFDLVVLVPLRNIEGNATIGEIVKHYLSDNNDVTAEQLDEYCKKNPDKVFILFDGLDEFTGDLSKKGSSDIVVRTLRCESLKQCTVLVSTRPWKADQIRGNVQIKKHYGFIGVQGFHKENLPAYIKKFFGTNTASAESLISFMDENDGIAENMAPFPIYTSMLCVMWRDLSEEKKGSIYLLQTFSQLFKSMMTFLVDHFIAKKLKNYSDAEEELEELHSKVFDDLLQIGKIAFEGLLVNQLNFTEDDFKECKGAKQTGCDVGVLTQEKRMAPRTQRSGDGFLRQHLMTTISFPHKLFQEYTAAMYLASLFDTQESDYDNFLKTEVLPKAAGYRYLLYFTAFMGKNVGLDIMRRLTSDDCRVSPNFVVDVAFECHKEEAARMVEDILKSQGKGSCLSIDDNMATHTISAYLFTLKQLEKLVISGKHSSSLSRDIAVAVCSMEQLQTLEISKSSLHGKFYQTAAEKASTCKVGSLKIRDHDMSADTEASCNAATWIGSMPCLKEIVLHNACFHGDFHSSMVSAVQSSKIETLKMEDFQGTPSASRDMGRWISSLSCLKHLYMDNMSFTDDFYSEAANRARSSMLEKLELLYADLNGREAGSCDAARWIASMSHLSTLTVLHCRCHETFYHGLASLSGSSKVQSLSFWTENSLFVRPEASKDVAEWIHSMPNLTDVQLYSPAFHDDFFSSAVRLAPNSKIVNVTIQKMAFSDRPTASRGAARWLLSLPHLKSLVLERVQFHPEFYSQAASGEVCSQMHSLTLIAALDSAPAPSADAAQWICSLRVLRQLTIHDSTFNAKFYEEVSAKVEQSLLSSLRSLSLEEGALLRLCDIGLNKVCPNVQQLTVMYERRVTPAVLRRVGLPDLRELSLRRRSNSDRPRLFDPADFCRIIRDSFNRLATLGFENIQIGIASARVILTSLMKDSSQLKHISMVKCNTTQQLDHLVKELTIECSIDVNMEHGQC